MGHPRSKLTVYGRRLLVARVAQGWPAAHVAEQLGVSRPTVYKWVNRFKAEGEAGLADRNSRPHRSPRRLREAIEAEVLAARVEWRYGPDRLGPLLGMPPSTVHRVLVRNGRSRLRDADRVTLAPVRYEACHPGALVHQDHKKLGRIPDGGGWRALGRDLAPHHGHSRVGYEHLEAIVDDASRYAVVVPVPDEASASAIWALERATTECAGLGIRVERDLTDNCANYKRTFDAAVERLGARHKRTGPRRPQTNGKAERLIKTLIHKWAYSRLYATNRERADALPVFVDFYNRRQPHTALGGRSPLDAVNNVSGDHTLCSTCAQPSSDDRGRESMRRIAMVVACLTAAAGCASPTPTPSPDPVAAWCADHDMTPLIPEGETRSKKDGAVIMAARLLKIEVPLAVLQADTHFSLTNFNHATLVPEPPGWQEALAAWRTTADYRRACESVYRPPASS